MATKANTKALRELKSDTRRAARSAIHDVRDRGKELLADEAPKKSEKLSKGVRHKENLSGALLTSQLLLSAVNPNKGGDAVLHLASGGTKKIKLRGGKAHDYALGVIEGTGVHGPRGEIIEPLRRKALLIGVDSVDPGESYIEGPGGQKYVVRLRSKGARPNPFHERAADRLENEAPEIVSTVLAREGIAL